MLPSDFDIFSPLTKHPVVHPEPGERRRPAPSRLRPLVLVVGEHEVEAAAVDVEARAEKRRRIAEHSMCQPGRPSPQGLGQTARPAWRPSTGRSRAATPSLAGLDPRARDERVRPLAARARRSPRSARRGSRRRRPTRRPGPRSTSARSARRSRRRLGRARLGSGRPGRAGRVLDVRVGVTRRDDSVGRDALLVARARRSCRRRR